MAEKTHDPTPKRLREAREKGDVPHAPLVASAVGLFVIVPLTASVLRKSAVGLAHTMSDPTAPVDAFAIAGGVLAGVAPIALTLIAIAAVSGVVQGTLTFSPKRLAPDASKLNPVAGLGRLIDKSKLWAAARGALVILLLGFVLGRVIVEAAARGAVSITPDSAIDAAISLSSRVVLTAGGLACAVALLDVIVSRRLWLGRHRMSRDEVIREHKEQEGDPEIKRRREELHHELMAAEALSAVRDASVVVINPTHLACALRYDDAAGDDAAPTLLAKGQGALAARMIEAARLHGVPVIRDVPVARALYELEVGTDIPEVLYEAVAEVLKAAWEED